MSASQPPPSSAIPTKSGGGLYLLLFIVFAGLTGLLIWYVRRPAQEVATPTPVETAMAEDLSPHVAPPPPPPPKLDDLVDAGTSDAGSAKVASTGGAGTGKGGCATPCQGTASSALQGALRGAASTAKSCYDRALQRNEVSGSMTVAVQIGASGTVCNASIVSDSVGSGEVSNCVLGRFRGRSFPAPDGGCVTVNIPISFTIKQ